MRYDEVILDGPLVCDAQGRIIGQWRQQHALVGREISVGLFKHLSVRWTPEDVPSDATTVLAARFGYSEHKTHGLVLVLTTDTPEIRQALSEIASFKVLW